MAKSIAQLISIYQYGISPLFGNHCRFHPNCSQYAKVAITRFSIRKGLILSIQRIGKCHPWHEGGYDPVPLQ